MHNILLKASLHIYKVNKKNELMHFIMAKNNTKAPALVVTISTLFFEAQNVFFI